jgi:hypothetical protein
MFAVSHLSQRLRVQNEVRRVGPARRLDHSLGSVLAVMSGSPLMRHTLASGTSQQHVSAQGRGRHVLLARCRCWVCRGRDGHDGKHLRSPLPRTIAALSRD